MFALAIKYYIRPNLFTVKLYLQKFTTMKTKIILLTLSLFLVSLQFFGQSMNSKDYTSLKTSESAKSNQLLNSAKKEQNAMSDLNITGEITEVLRLKLSCDANSYYDEAVIIFNDSDPTQGAAKLMSMYSSAPELWSVKKGLNYSISFLGGLDSTVIVPISVKAGVPGNYTLSSTQIASFGANIEIILEDRVSGSFINLGISPEYTFQVNAASTMADRFFIHFVDIASDLNKSITSFSEKNIVQPFKIFAMDGNIKISSLQQLSGKIILFDMLGHKIATDFVDAGANTQIDMNGKTGVYIVSVLSSKGRSNTKILVR